MPQKETKEKEGKDKKEKVGNSDKKDTENKKKTTKTDKKDNKKMGDEKEEAKKDDKEETKPKNESEEKEKDDDEGKEKKSKKKKEVQCFLDDKQLEYLNSMPKILGEVHLHLETHVADVTEFCDIVNAMDAAVDSLEDKHRGHKFQLVWKIDGFYRKFRDAKKRLKPILFSPCFQTHNYGYQMALSFCPYGDGKC